MLVLKINTAQEGDYCTTLATVVPLLRDHPAVHTKVVFEEGLSFIWGRKQCKPKQVSSVIVVLNVRWSLIRGSLKRGTTVYRKEMTYILQPFYKAGYWSLVSNA